MYVCMYVCTYACKYACTYVCMYVCMYVCLFVCLYVCLYLGFVDLVFAGSCFCVPTSYQLKIGDADHQSAFEQYSWTR